MNLPGGTVPHDFGDPSEDPYLKINSYLMHGIFFNLNHLISSNYKT